MKTYTYVAVFEEDKEDGGYIVTFPSLQGCITYGKTIEKALYMAKDVLKLYALDFKENKVPFPVEKNSLLKRASTFYLPISVKVK